ncbi:MAG: prolyl oligopeptidase family serine peptidase [Nitrososphaerales archaeon]|nr:prolyl oligopeptidase family serine peptidase [Nitrososphaerales archaeon]
MKRTIAPYGSWRSPITPELLAVGTSVPSELTVDGDDLYWLRLLPHEEGRYALYRRNKEGETAEVLGSEFNVRTRVHEYGGGSYLVHRGTVFFSNFKDQLVYQQDPGGSPEPITKAGLRYADCVFDERRGRVIGVAEDHTVSGRLPNNSLASVELDGSPAQVMASGNDFYSSPRLDPSGSTLAWLTWNFPNMPWDGTELWVGEIGNDGSVSKKEFVAGGRTESIFQPTWSPDGTLYFVSDRSGWWNLYRWVDGKMQAVRPMNVDFGRPQWAFRLSTHAFVSETTMICSFMKNGTWHLAVLNNINGALKPIKLPFTELAHVRVRNGRPVFLAGSPTEPMSVVELNLARNSWKVLYRPDVPRVRAGFASVPRHIEFPTTGRRKAYAFFYGPTNKNYSAPRGERPPLLVISHGGPTSATATSASLAIQAWTSRGFAVVDVNYGGSSGYGRGYRRRLNGQWGVVDVDDCANAAKYLARTGKADGRRLVIRGGSAGGYTTLCALTFRNVFKAGASYFGVSDAEGLAKDTHKFESKYLDSLIGTYPEERDLYRERSPIHHVERLSCPVIFFQGLEDVVVPPSQAETMVESLRARGIPVAYIPFEGEQHGFRRATTIRRAFEAELFFYSKVFGFALADPVEPVEIENLRS